MNVSLPDEIQVIETAGTRRYTLPRRPMSPPLRRRFWMILAFAAMVGSMAALFTAQSLRGGPQQNFPCFGVVGVIVGGGLLIYAIQLCFTRCAAEIGADNLKLCEWRGPFANRRERSLEQIRAIVMHPLMEAGEPDAAEVPVETGVIEIQCDGIQPLWWGHEYPRDWLTALAAELNERCGLSGQSARLPSKAVGEAPSFVLPQVPDFDTADVEDRPPGCPVRVKRSADQIVLEFPPPGYWQADQAKPRLVMAGLFTLVPLLIVAVNVIQMVEHGLPSPPTWLFVGGLLCVGPALLLGARHHAGSQLSLTVQNDRLTRTKKSPVFGLERISWRPSEILALRITASAKKGKGPPVASVMLFPLNGPAIALLEASTNQQEMGYIATLLRQVLQVPAVADAMPSPPSTGAPIHSERSAKPASEEASLLVRRRRQLLPPEILFTPTATGSHYQLPWLKPTQALRSRTFGCSLLVLVFLAFGTWLCVGVSLPQWLANIGPVRMVVGGALLFFGIAGLFAFLAIVIRRDAVEISPDGLRFVQRVGINVVRKQWPRESIRRIVTQHYSSPPESPLAEPLGTIEVKGEGSSSHNFGGGYPVSMLLPLAEEIAERMNVPHEETATPGAQRLSKTPVAPETEPLSEDLLDQEAQPASSRAVVEKNASGFSTTLPPTGYRQNRQARNWLPFLMAALTFMLLNIVATARLAVVPKAAVEQIILAAFWLVASTIVAALLAARVFYLTRKQTVIAVHNGMLNVVRSNPLTREKQQEWSRSQVAEIRLGCATRQMQTEKGRAVCLFTNDGRRVNLVAGDDEDELRWLATTLRKALNVPAVG